MARQKLIRFDENRENPLVIQPGKPDFLTIKGRWRSDFFKNDKPLVLELGCGRGEYTLGLARLFSEKNFVGVDIKGGRLWRGARTGFEEGMTNVGFLRVKIENIVHHFDRNEVDEIWITFPDPRPKDRDERRRLTSPRFLDLFRQIMPSGGIVNLKTDDDGLYTYTRAVIKQQNLRCFADTDDLYKSKLLEGHQGLVTTYERKWLGMGKSIKYLKFSI